MAVALLLLLLQPIAAAATASTLAAAATATATPRDSLIEKASGTVVLTQLNVLCVEAQGEVGLDSNSYRVVGISPRPYLSILSSSPKPRPPSRERLR